MFLFYIPVDYMRVYLPSMYVGLYVNPALCKTPPLSPLPNRLNGCLTADTMSAYKVVGFKKY